jgi:hypothetical protein
MKAPNNKRQIANKFQSQSTQSTRFGNWNFEFGYYLGFEIRNFISLCLGAFVVKISTRVEFDVF